MKKKIITYALFIIVITLIQTNIIDAISILGVKPNLLIVFVIVVGLTNGSETGAFVGFVAGLVMDSFSPTPVGIYAIIGMYLGVIAGISNRSFFRDNYILTMVFAFIYSVAFETIVYVFVMSGQYWQDGIGSVFINLLYSYKNFILLEAAYNMPFALILHLLSFKFLVGLDKEGRRLKYRRGY